MAYAQPDGASATVPSVVSRPLIISTWEFGLPGNERAMAALRDGGSTLDAVEAGIRHVESAGIHTVGLSGRPNANGRVQLDACIMHGPGHRAGAVAALEGIAHPITAARRVMEKTPHVMLAGEGARQFALEQRLQSVPLEERPSERAAKSDASSEPAPSPGPENHDTITLLVLGADGDVSGGCSTSGLAGKLPGRVGDSPIVGAGLYVDNEVGAAGATGVGENVMRYCASFLLVEFMRQGMSPQEACGEVIDRIRRSEPAGKDLAINFIALDKQGRFGAAGTGPFPYAVTCPEFSKILRV